MNNVLKTVIILVSMAAIPLISERAVAQDAEEQSQSFALPAPQTPPEGVFSPLAGLDVKQLDAYYNILESLKGEHHRPIPLGEDPVDISPMSMLSRDDTTAIRTLPPAFDEESVRFVMPPRRLDEVAGRAGTVAEPSVAWSGNTVFVTANWFAAYSKDNGNTFQFVDPAGIFPASPFGSFCCDQVALYHADSGYFFWFLQYRKNQEANIFRIAFAKPENIENAEWQYVDLTPTDLNRSWENEWFDYPELVTTRNNLYISSNVFSTMGGFTRSVLLRIPIKSLISSNTAARYYASSNYGSLRPVHGADQTMYFAAHRNRQTLSVFEWPESAGNITRNDIRVQTWSSSRKKSFTPDGKNWLERSDTRITAAWRDGKILGFAWTVAKDPIANLPHAHVRVALIDRAEMKVKAEPHIWNDQYAYAYPAVAPNASGDIGISIAFGGNIFNPSISVGILKRSAQESIYKWVLRRVVSGTNGPSQDSWGDYLAVRPVGGTSDEWVATGFVLEGGQNRDFVRVYITRFAPP